MSKGQEVGIDEKLDNILLPWMSQTKKSPKLHNMVPYSLLKDSDSIYQQSAMQIIHSSQMWDVHLVSSQKRITLNKASEWQIIDEIREEK